MSSDSKKEVTKKQPGALSTAVDFGEYAGQGMDNVTNDDMVIPFLGLLQDLSPEVKKNRDEYIEGAEPGMMFNTVTRELFEKEFYFVPVCREHNFIEWIPRDAGGGFVGVHEVDSDVVREARARAGSSFGDLKTPAGNELVETYSLYGLQIEGPESTESVCPVVISFNSTKIKVYKRLVTQLRLVKGAPPMFAFRLCFRTVGEQNRKKQDYHNFVVTPACGSLNESMNLPGGEFENLLNEGSALLNAVRSGAARAATESVSQTEDQGDGDTPF